LLRGSNVGATSVAIELDATSDLPGVVIFPARAPGARPITVLLHGMCGDAARACSHFAEQVTQTSNLVCPRASARCTGGGASWPDQGVADAVEAAITRAKSTLLEVDESHGRTLIGYSMGAYRAVNIAQGSPGKYPRVMLIGANVSLDRARLTRNGTERVLLCAGSWDMMHDPMRREAERVRRAGLQARFMDLGPVGHAFTPSFAEYLPQALSWLAGA
jgi:predicted esterase